MTFAPGQITGTDLSATANILGTQIADKTLQFRNFNEAVFKIIASGTGVAPGFTLSAAGTNTFSGSGTNSYPLPGELNFIPSIIGFVVVIGLYYLLPYTDVYTLGASGGIGTGNYSVSVDSNNVYVTQTFVEYGGSASARVIPSTNVKYYLLQQTVNETS